MRGAEEMRELGYTVAYVYARDITEPTKIIDALATVADRLG